MARGLAMIGLLAVLTAAFPGAALAAQNRPATVTAKAEAALRDIHAHRRYHDWLKGIEFRQVARRFAKLLRDRGNGGKLSGAVTSDYGALGHGLGIADSVAAPRRDETKISIRDLLANDLGLRCDHPCKFADTRRLDLTLFRAGDNVKRIERRGQFLVVEAKRGGKSATFSYDLIDRGSGSTSKVDVKVWFGNHEPRARPDRLVTKANRVTSYDVSALLGNDRDRDGDRLELVRVWCPLGGRVFTQEVNGKLRVFFQPDANFTGVAYFHYTIADLDDPAAHRVAGLTNGGGLVLPERKTFARGLVRVRVVASRS